MMAITTRSSMSVKPRLLCLRPTNCVMDGSPSEKTTKQKRTDDQTAANGRGIARSPPPSRWISLDDQTGLKPAPATQRAGPNRVGSPLISTELGVLLGGLLFHLQGLGLLRRLRFDGGTVPLQF